MVWRTVETKTEEVIDTNPEVWINAAESEWKNQHYDKALENLQQAREFANNASSPESILIKSYAIEICVHYDKGDTNSALEIKREHYSENFKDFLYKNPEYIVKYLEYDKENWQPVWESDIVAKWVSKENLNKILQNHLLWLNLMCQQLAYLLNLLRILLPY